MNPRHRYVRTLTFGSPDRIPFQPGWGRESTHARWRREGVPEDRDPYDFLREVLGIERENTQPPIDLGVDFRLIPQFDEKVLQHRDGHYVVQDWKGNVCEISDDFDVTYLRQAKDFVTRRWVRCPVETREDWQELRKRYQLDEPGRFPDDFVERCTQAKGRDSVLQVNFPGPFWIMREWCGFEGLCMMMVEQPDLVDEMSDFWRTFVSGMLERVCRHVTPDAVFISEDMAYKGKSMISMDMARRFCMPCWRVWSGQLKSAGVPIIDMDSDGYVGELIPLWIEAGINVCDPLEVAAGCDIVEMRQRFGHSIAFRQGVDKRAIAAGGQAIRDELSRVEPIVREGGYIPGCDHGVPHDISWPNFVDYSRRLAEMTGWL